MALAVPTGLSDNLEELFRQRISFNVPPEKTGELYPPILRELVEDTRERLSRLFAHSVAVDIQEHVDLSLKRWLTGDRKVAAFNRYKKFMRRQGVVPANIYKLAFFVRTGPRAGICTRWAHIEKEDMKIGSKVILGYNSEGVFTVSRILPDCNVVLQEQPGTTVPATSCLVVEC